MIGSNNKLNNAMATIRALCDYKHAGHFAKMCNERKVTSDEEVKEEKVVKPTVKVEKKVINNKTIEVEVPAADAAAAKPAKTPAKE